MVGNVKVDVIENAYLPFNEEDSINLRVVLIENRGTYYEIAVSKDMKICYIRLAKDIISKGASERFQFSVHINCKEFTINMFKEHTTTDRKKGVGWFTEEEWNFRGLTHQTCSWAYKLMNFLRVKLLLINEKDKQQALKISEKLEKHIELLIKILESEEIEEIVYCKSKFLISTHTRALELFFDDSSEETAEMFYDHLPELIN